jgi:uncharacterized protein involved in outer membrane biogenesis
MRILRLTITGLLALVVALGLAGYLVLRNLDLDDYKGVIAAKVKEITSRDLDIRGHITFTISLKPTITARDLTLANASWASDPTMLAIDRLDVAADLITLLFGNFDTTELTIEGGRLALERGADDRANWQLGLDQEDVEQTQDYLAGPFPYVHAIRLENFDVDYADRQSETKLTAHLNSFDATFDPKEQGLRTNLDAKARDQTVVASGTVANLISLNKGGSSAVDLSIQLGQTKLSFDGTVDAETGASSLQGTFAAAGPGSGDLAALAGVSLPDLGAIKADAKIALTRTALDLTALDLRLGDSDLRGQAKIGLEQQLSLAVDLSSNRIDATPLVKFWKSDDAAPAEETTKPGLLFSDKPLSLDKLPSIVLDVTLAIDKLVMGELTLDTILLKVAESDRTLKVDPFKLVYKGATFTGRASVAATKPPSVSLKVLTQNFDLGSFLAQQDITDLVQGEIDVGIDVQGQGNSLHTLVGSLDGAAGFVMSDGLVASRYIDLIAADILPMLMPWRKIPKESYIKCALLQFEIKNGKAKTRSLLFDTKTMTILGKGKINLKSETIHARLRPRPKNPTLASLATGLLLTGNLQDIKVSLDKESLLIKAAEAVAGIWLLGPAGILVPFASLGAGHHHPCVDDLQKTFGTEFADEMDDGKTPPAASGDEHEEAPQASPVPTVIRIAGSPDEVFSNVIKRHLEDLGFGDIAEVEKQGGIFHADANWQGRPLKLRIDVRRGTIEHSDP